MVVFAHFPLSIGHSRNRRKFCFISAQSWLDNQTGLLRFPWKIVMASLSWQSWHRWAILAPLFMGCQSFFANQGPPNDPLFFSKAPMTAKVEYGPPITYAYLEPSAPLDPRGNGTVIVEQNARPVPGTLTNRTIENE
jgi:hypothetical protein